MKLRFLILALSTIMVLVGGSCLALPDSGEVDPDVAAVVNANNNFAVDLYAILAKEEGNLFFSPYSVSAALAMTFAGARGETARQMEQTLHFDLADDKLNPGFASLSKLFNVADKSYRLTVANALWGQEGTEFCPDFLAITKKYYDAGFMQVDYINNTEEARQTINRWVETKTNQKIVDLLKPGILNEDTRLVLTNTIYFKGNWEWPFDSNWTDEAPFQVAPEVKPNVPMMYQSQYFKYNKTDRWQILELPYQGGDIVMDILLPTSPADLGLHWPEIQSLLAKMEINKVEVYLPRFKIEKEILLGQYLKSLGMQEAFDQIKANFSGITDMILYISEVVQKTFVGMNEAGTEAAAATAVGMREESIGHAFKADHPFVFLIRDLRSGSILFMGRMVDPRQRPNVVGALSTTAKGAQNAMSNLAQVVSLLE